MNEIVVKATRSFLAAAMLVMVSASLTLSDGSGVYGRAAWRGELVEGVVVYAYSNESNDFLSGEVALSAPTGTDGTYRLPLAPGRYTLIARSVHGKEAGRPRAGDYYCYYSGSPIIVREGFWEPVGFNLVKYTPEMRSTGEGSSLEGIVTYRDAPLERLYLNIYRDGSQNFRGPAMATYPVGSGGQFRVKVPPGKYFVIARKRLRGGMYGPMEIGDYFNYYPSNPVFVGENEKVRFNLETVTRLSQLEEGKVPLPSIKGNIIGSGGGPVEGVRVFAYSPDKLSGRPLYFSDPSNAEGRFSLSIPESGKFSLVAREKFGGPARSGEYSGTYLDGAPVRVDGTGSQVNVVTITVRRKE